MIKTLANCVPVNQAETGTPAFTAVNETLVEVEINGVLAMFKISVYIDVDECALETDNCALLDDDVTIDTLCINTHGGFNCTENPDPFGVCENRDCGADTSETAFACVVVLPEKTEFVCQCGPGYVVDSATNACVDEDECMTTPDVCKSINAPINPTGKL